MAFEVLDQVIYRPLPTRSPELQRHSGFTAVVLKTAPGKAMLLFRDLTPSSVVALDQEMTK